ncbi:MAG: fibronectin type III domain-containing protein [Oscillospiraceae bacterium]|nr:fibronectin type III domain-containing protein [Oscillospiraceae bacterium]
MKKLLAMLLAGLLLITSMSVMAWADDEEPVGDILPGLRFDSLSELWEYIDWLDEDYVSRADEMNFSDGLLEYLYYDMEGIYFPDCIDIGEVRSVYVDPRYVSVGISRDDEVLSLYSFDIAGGGKTFTKEYITLAKNSGVVTTLDNGTEVYYCRFIGTGSYVFVQDGVYYLLTNWTNGDYDESLLEYCNAVYHSFGEAYGLSGEAVDGKVKLSWDEVVEDSTYTVYWKRSTSDEWKVAGTTSKEKVSITGLKSGVNYDFKIEATGVESEIVTVTAG